MIPTGAAQPSALSVNGERGVWVPRSDALLLRHILAVEVPLLETEVHLSKETIARMDSLSESLMAQNGLLRQANNQADTQIRLLTEQRDLMKKGFEKERGRRRRQQLYKYGGISTLAVILIWKSQVDGF